MNVLDYDDEVELNDPLRPFGVGASFATHDHFTCGMCGKEFNGRPHDQVVGLVYYADFGPLKIGGCCFRRFEEAVRAWLAEAIVWDRADEASQFDKQVAQVEESFGIQDNT